MVRQAHHERKFNPFALSLSKGEMKVIEAPSADKKSHLERLLGSGLIMIIVDARLDTVRVPPEHKANPKLPLNLSYAFEIADFKVWEDRVEASLSFKDIDFFCILPFDAIYMAHSQIQGETIIFPENVPKDLVLDMGPQQPAETSAPEPKPSKKKSHLKLVE